MTPRADIFARDLHLDITRFRAEFLCKGNLSRKKIFKRTFTIAHRTELVLPNRGRIRIGHFIGKYIDQKKGRGRRMKILLLSFGMQKFPLDEVIDNRRTGRLRTDAVDIL